MLCVISTRNLRHSNTMPMAYSLQLEIGYSTKSCFVHEKFKGKTTSLFIELQVLHTPETAIEPHRDNDTTTRSSFGRRADRHASWNVSLADSLVVLWQENQAGDPNIDTDLTRVYRIFLPLPLTRSKGSRSVRAGNTPVSTFAARNTRHSEVGHTSHKGHASDSVSSSAACLVCYTEIGK